MQKIKNMSKKKKRLILIVLALLVVVGAAAYTVFIKPQLNQEKWVYMESPVEQGDLTVGVTESGTLEYGVTSQLYDLNVSTVTSDDEDEIDAEVLKYLQVEEVYVAVGQRISAGDAVMKFTDKSVDALRKKLTYGATEAEVALEEAQAEYNVKAISAKETYNLSQSQSGSAGGTYDSAILIAQNSITENQVEIERLQAEIVSYQNQIEDAQDDYDDALEDYNDAKAAMEAVGTSNQIVAIKFESSYLQAKAAYENAKNTLEKITDGIQDDQDKIEELQKKNEAAAAKLNIDQLEAKKTYDSTAATGSVAATTYEATLASLKTTVDTAQTEVDTLTERLNAFEEFVGDGTVYAEGDGIVTEIGYEADDTLESSGTVVAFAAEGDMTISVDVSQEDVVALSVGDPVEIVFSAYSDEVYEGTISSITTDNTSSNSTTVSYPVIIAVSGDTSALYGGMTADVTFVTEQHTDTIYVSKKAIISQDDGDYVYVEKNGKYILQKVTTGLSNGTSIEITEGLNPGDTIFIASKVSNTSSENSDASAESSSEETQMDAAGSGTGTNQGMPDMSNMPNMGNMSNMPSGGQMPGMGGAQ